MAEPVEPTARLLIGKSSGAKTPADSIPADKMMPVELDALSRAITSAGHRAYLHCEEFVGMTAVVSSSAMARLFAVASRVADSMHPVLITGDSDVGKELIARAVHQYSSRCAGPF